MERQLIEDYRRSVEAALSRLTADNVPKAVELASLPEQIRGFGHVKLASVEKAKVRWAALDAELAGPSATKVVPLRAA